MKHGQKGVIGLFTQGINHLYIDNLKIKKVLNTGTIGIEDCDEYLTTQNPKYTGCQTRGMCLKTSRNIHIINFIIDDIKSEMCEAIGFDMMHDNKYAQIINLETYNVTVTPRGPNTTPYAFPTQISGTAISVVNLTV